MLQFLMGQKINLLFFMFMFQGYSCAKRARETVSIINFFLPSVRRSLTLSISGSTSVMKLCSGHLQDTKCLFILRFVCVSLFFVLRLSFFVSLSVCLPTAVLWTVFPSFIKFSKVKFPCLFPFFNYTVFRGHTLDYTYYIILQTKGPIYCLGHCTYIRWFLGK